jgi:hypothetical protein
VGPFLFEETITAENYPNFIINLLPCWKGVKGIAGFSKIR